MINQTITSKVNYLSEWLKKKINDKNFELEFINIEDLSEKEIIDAVAKSNSDIIESREGKLSRVVNNNNKLDWGKNLDYFPFHLDGGSLKSIPNFVILYCAKNSAKGGGTFFAKAQDILLQLTSKFSNNFLQSLYTNYISPQNKIYTKPLIEYLDNEENAQLNFFSSMYLSVNEKNIYNEERRLVTFTLAKFQTELIKQLKKNIYYTHSWRKGDLVLFNNRTLLHGRNKIMLAGGERLLYRIWFNNNYN